MRQVIEVLLLIGVLIVIADSYLLLMYVVAISFDPLCVVSQDVLRVSEMSDDRCDIPGSSSNRVIFLRKRPTYRIIYRFNQFLRHL